MDQSAAQERFRRLYLETYEARGIVAIAGTRSLRAIGGLFSRPEWGSVLTFTADTFRTSETLMVSMVAPDGSPATIDFVNAVYDDFDVAYRVPDGFDGIAS
jgi:hypothetical protein